MAIRPYDAEIRELVPDWPGDEQPLVDVDLLTVAAKISGATADETESAYQEAARYMDEGDLRGAVECLVPREALTHEFFEVLRAGAYFRSDTNIRRHKAMLEEFDLLRHQRGRLDIEVMCGQTTAGIARINRVEAALLPGHRVRDGLHWLAQRHDHLADQVG